MMLTTGILFAQAPNEAKFKFETGMGTGVLPTFAKDRSSNLGPPLSGYVTYRMPGNWSIGMTGGFSASSLQRVNRITGDPESIVNRFHFAGLRTSVHTDPFRFARWDLYAGANAFYSLSEISISPLVKSADRDADTDKTYKSGFSATGFLGARFAATRHIGAWAELGFGVSILNAGLSYRFAKKPVRKSYSR